MEIPIAVAALATAVILLTTGFWLLFRSFRRWPQLPPGRDPESRAAEARLWSTHTGDV